LAARRTIPGPAYGNRKIVPIGAAVPADFHARNLRLETQHFPVPSMFDSPEDIGNCEDRATQNARTICFICLIPARSSLR
jgi:hypothetical protein